jgi:hypothetical protein
VSLKSEATPETAACLVAKGTGDDALVSKMVGRMGRDRGKESILGGSLVPELELLFVSRAAVLVPCWQPCHT